jgi:uncharacterized membrane protein
MAKGVRRSPFIVFAVIATASFAAIVPMFWLGVPSGHDFEFHMDSWMEVSNQWEQGILYPRWAALANYGYGEPRFVFYPPASWLLGAALGTVLPWPMVPGVYIWLVLTAAGCSMFALARPWLPRQHAAFAAVLYAVNPYHLVIVYWRSAFAELMASVWLPLLLLFVLRLPGDGAHDSGSSGPRHTRAGKIRSMLYLALVVAAVWLTNAPSAVMVNYSLVLLVMVRALVRRSPRVLFYGAGSCALGLALAAFYVLPAAYEKQWVNIQEVLALGVRPQSNFLFAVIADPEHNRFNLLVSIMAVLEILLLSVALLLSRHRRREHPELWWTLTAWGAATAVLMFPFTFILWKYLPELRFIQLPWRWLLCLNVAFVLLLTMGIRRWLARALVYAAMLVALAGVWRWVQPPWWDQAADIREMSDNLDEGRGYESVREYVPTRGDLEAIKRNAPEVAAEGQIGKVQIDDWAPESKAFTITVSEPSRVVLRLFNYPAWKVQVNGRSVAAETQARTGQMVIPVQAGKNNLEIIFSRTPDRTWGAEISGVALLAMVGLLFAAGKKKPDAIPAPMAVGS